jgi:hypothetical protein
MNPWRFTIASLSVAVVVVGLDLVWIKHLLTAHRSAFGFVAEGWDMGLFLMANVLPFGIYPMFTRRGERRRFLVGFEAGGLSAMLAYACCSRLAPGGVERVIHAFLDPPWDLLFGRLQHGIGELVITLVFLAIGIGFPQLLVALACGKLAGRGLGRRSRTGAADPRLAGDAPTCS